MSEVIAVGSYFKFWWPDLPSWIPGLAVVLILLSANLVSVKWFGEFEFWFAAVKVVTIILMIIAGLGLILFGIGNDFNPIGISHLWDHGGFFTGGLSGFFFALSIVFGSYIGIELIGITAGYPSAMYLISYEGKRTGKDSQSKILTMLSISNQTISVIGPTIGGLLIHSGGWQAIFLVNVPLSILSFVFGFLYYTKVESPKKLNALKEQIDFIGITLFTITLTTWMIFFMEPDQSIFYLFIIGLFSLIAFVIMELKSKKPFIDLRVLGHNGALNNTYVRSLLTAVISYSVLYGYVQWLEEGRGLTAAHAGLMMIPQFLVGIFMAQLTGTRLSIKFKLYLGTICALITMIGFQFIQADTPLWILILLAAIFGVPQGLLNLANQNALYHQAPKSMIGMSAGLLRTAMYIGAIVSSTLISTLFKGDHITNGIHELGLFCMLIGLVIIILTFVSRRSLSAR